MPGQDIEGEIGHSIVLLTIEDEQGTKITLGSGFLVDELSLVATCRHVIWDASKAVAEFQDGAKVPIKGVRATDTKRDLAILELESVPAHAKPLALGPRVPPKPGDHVTAIGHPAGLKFSVTDGIVSAVRKRSDQPAKDGTKVRPEEDTTWVQTTAMISGGNSGGPLLSNSGEVLGVNAFAIPARGLGFATHVSHLIDVIEKARSSKAIPFAGERLAADVENPVEMSQPIIAEMDSEFQRAQQQWLDRIENAWFYERDNIIKNQNPRPKYAQRFLQIAQKKPKKLTGFQGLYMACVTDEVSGPAPYLKEALQKIEADHIDDKGLCFALPGLSQIAHESIGPFLQKVLETSHQHDNQGTACILLAYQLAGELNAPPTPPGEKKPKVRPSEDEVLDLLKRCQTEFQDVRMQQASLAEWAKPVVFQIEHLSIGKKPPEIEGKDVDGNPFKLSDYAGKVVVLDFFADWCPYCVESYPEERNLVKQHESQPFALLGVNCDSNTTLSQIIQDGKVTWKCWSDGKGGPISQTWQVEALPCIYVLNQNGVIKQKFQGRPRPGALEKAIAELLEGKTGDTTKSEPQDTAKPHDADKSAASAKPDETPKPADSPKPPDTLIQESP